MSDVTVGLVREYIANQQFEIAGRYGNGYKCTLRYTVGGDLFEVIDHGETIYRGSDVQKAVDTFNEISS